MSFAVVSVFSVILTMDFQILQYYKQKSCSVTAHFVQICLKYAAYTKYLSFITIKDACQLTCYILLDGLQTDGHHVQRFFIFLHVFFGMKVVGQEQLLTMRYVYSINSLKVLSKHMVKKKSRVQIIF